MQHVAMEIDRPDFERDRHACPVHLDQNVARQRVLEIDVAKRVDQPDPLRRRLLHQPGDHLARVIVPKRGSEWSPGMGLQCRGRQPHGEDSGHHGRRIVPVLRRELADPAGRLQMAIGCPGHPRQQSVGKEPSHPYPAHGPAVPAIAGEDLVRTIPRQGDGHLFSSLHRQVVGGRKE